MKKLYKLLLLVMLIFIVSCGGVSSSNAGHPNIDGTTFDYLAGFVYNNIEYNISFPNNGDASAFYQYEETCYKTKVKNWTINYYYEANYIYDQYFNENEEIYNCIYETLMLNIEEIEEKLGYKVETYSLNSLNEVEVTLNNVFDSEINCVIMDKYIPIRLRNTFKNYSYTISIPVKRYHIVKSDNLVVNPFNNEIISWEDFLAIPNINEKI